MRKSVPFLQELMKDVQLLPLVWMEDLNVSQPLVFLSCQNLDPRHPSFGIVAISLLFY